MAFGPWWTGFPFGTDLTDNKWLVGLAVLFMIAVFTIPHSVNGSEYDYATETISTEN